MGQLDHRQFGTNIGAIGLRMDQKGRERVEGGADQRAAVQPGRDRMGIAIE